MVELPSGRLLCAYHSYLPGPDGGGDEGVMKAFVDAVTHNDQSRVLTGADETLDSHLIVFAAERARRDSTVVEPGRSANN